MASPFLFLPERAGFLDGGEWCVCSRTQMLILPKRPSRSPRLPVLPEMVLDFVAAMRSGPVQWLEMRAGDLLNWLCSAEDPFVGIEGVFVQRGLLAMAIRVERIGGADAKAEGLVADSWVWVVDLKRVEASNGFPVAGPAR